VDNNYLDLSMNKSGLVHTLLSGRLNRGEYSPFVLGSIVCSSLAK
jgi:hypothetical protein